MAQLTPNQIAYYAYKAGFRGDALNQAVAIALAESGGRTDAYNPESAAGTRAGSGSRGLWQIYGTAHPEFNNPKAFDPQVNANAAFKVFREAGNRFSPWSTWNLGVRATKDYSKLNFKSMSPVSSVARGSVSSIVQPKQQQKNNSFAGAVSGAGAVATQPTLKTFLGIPAESGPQVIDDAVFMVIGGAVLLIGIFGLLINLYASQVNATGKFISANATKLTGVL